jgi:cell division control protein 24
MSVTSAPRASQLSGATAFTSTTSLNSLASSATLVNPQIAPSSGNVVATSNIINQRADASRSLYQICVSLKNRLAQVPGFEEYSKQLDQMAQDPDEGGPVESVWKLLRTGHPLLVIYNALEPEERLSVEEVANATEEKLSKIAIMKFYRACLNDLKLPPAESFMIKDLTGSDTTGFVKVSEAPGCRCVRLLTLPLGHLCHQLCPRSGRPARLVK